jgi:hypothetical protein
MARNHNDLKQRPQHNWWSMLARGEVVSCKAISKRSGRRCRMPPTKGCGGVCFWHGARGGNGNFRAPTSKRNLANKETKRARAMSQADVERRLAAGELREAAEALKPLIGKIHPADEARALLMLDALFDGSLTPEGWREAQRGLGLLPQRMPTAPPAQEPEPFVSFLEWDRRRAPGASS